MNSLRCPGCGRRVVAGLFCGGTECARSGKASADARTWRFNGARIVDAQGKTVLGAFHDCGEDGMSVTADLDVSDEHAHLMAAAPDLLAALRREHDANHPFPMGPLCGCATCALVAGIGEVGEFPTKG